MEESTFETFEEELGTPLQEAPPPKPIRQARRPEMYAQRRMREEPPVPQQVPKTIPREPPSSRTSAMSGLRKALSMQNLSQVEVPFQGVTLNRCLFIAITILVITSGFQRLHETLRGRRDVVEEEEEDSGLSLRHSGLKKHQREPEPENSLWDTLLWWVADDDDDDDEKEKGRGRKKRGAQEKASRSLRHRSLPGKSLLKRSEGSLHDRRRKRSRGEEEEEDERVRGKREHKKRAKKIEEEEDDEELEDDEEEEKPKKIQKKSKNVKEKQTQPKGKEMRKKAM